MRLRLIALVVLLATTRAAVPIQSAQVFDLTTPYWEAQLGPNSYLCIRIVTEQPSSQSNAHLIVGYWAAAVCPGTNARANNFSGLVTLPYPHYLHLWLGNGSEIYAQFWARKAIKAQFNGSSTEFFFKQQTGNGLPR
ncbi:MAG TPA: hypothetical protein VGK01_26165 [Candidatus Angelobacter sp.]|jgi:hypothetical protein